MKEKFKLVELGVSVRKEHKVTIINREKFIH